MVLKRARRSAQHTEYSSTRAQPRPPAACMVQKYSSIAGATPKLTKSDRESSSAPNLLVPCRSLAIRPSSPSRTPASRIDTTPDSHFSCNPKRIEVRPAHSASMVRILGSSLLNDSPEMRGGRRRRNINSDLPVADFPGTQGRPKPFRRQRRSGPPPPGGGLQAADKRRRGCRNGSGRPAARC